jgi:hypothetical protein
VAPDDVAAAGRGPRLLGVFFLFGGAAVLGYILWGLPYRLVLGLTITLLVVASIRSFRGADAARRAEMKRMWWAGAIAGLVATAAYDLARLGLSYLDPQPFDPFGAIPAFGEMALGPGKGAAAVIAAGTAVHVLNGVTFGTVYVFLFPKKTVATGVGWGLFLETFQLALYPGWLGITTLREFVTVSVGGHIVYGAALGVGSRRLMRDVPSSTREVHQ